MRACKELGIPEIMCEIKTYKDEDSIIKDLLETNIYSGSVVKTQI